MGKKLKLMLVRKMIMKIKNKINDKKYYTLQKNYENNIEYILKEESGLDGVVIIFKDIKLLKKELPDGSNCQMSYVVSEIPDKYKKLYVKKELDKKINNMLQIISNDMIDVLMVSAKKIKVNER